jgi:hypothetical protein
VTERLELDGDGLLEVLGRVADRRFVGAVDGFGCVELVFEGSDENLVSIYTQGLHAGRVALGGVADPEGYARRRSRRRPWGVCW